MSEFLARQPGNSFSYPEIGASRGEFPRGYFHDRRRECLGTGEATFLASAAAIKEWRQFDVGWLKLISQRTTPIEGHNAAILVRKFGLYALSACRVVYVVDEPRRYGFAYGTLSDHVEVGEERFLAEWGEDGRVHYEIAAFSWPGTLTTCVGLPLVRRLQKRFARDSCRAMREAVAGAATPL